MKTARKFKYSGQVEPGSLVHSPVQESPVLGAPDGSLIPPATVPTAWGYDIPQYAATVNGTFNGYDPAGDCDGYYMSNKYQANNNCYAYATLICPNTFPQPGRATTGSVNFWSGTGNFTAENVKNNAVLDGLKYVGVSINDIKTFATTNTNGHFVALMFSAPEANIGGDPLANWSGDYHWARCDDSVNFASWSQKDGNDQVTNFDFAGNPITNPAIADWRVNQGPINPTAPGAVPASGSDNNEYVVSYDFFCFMFVPNTGVTII